MSSDAKLVMTLIAIAILAFLMYASNWDVERILITSVVFSSGLVIGSWMSAR